jgi:hypothetical protein
MSRTELKQLANTMEAILDGEGSPLPPLTPPEDRGAIFLRGRGHGLVMARIVPLWRWWMEAELISVRSTSGHAAG